MDYTTMTSEQLSELKNKLNSEYMEYQSIAKQAIEKMDELSIKFNEILNEESKRE